MLINMCYFVNECVKYLVLVLLIINIIKYLQTASWHKSSNSNGNEKLWWFMFWFPIFFTVADDICETDLSLLIFSSSTFSDL